MRLEEGSAAKVGFAITALVLFAVGGLVYAALLDQRYHEEMSSTAEDADGSTESQ